MHEYSRALLTCGGDIKATAALLNVEQHEVMKAWLEDSADTAAFFNALRQYLILNRLELIMRTQEMMLEKVDEMGVAELVKVSENSIQDLTHFLGLAPANQAINFNFSNGNVQEDAGMLSWVRKVAQLRGWDPDEAVAEATRILRPGDN